jgi:hypothetical protein
MAKSMVQGGCISRIKVALNVMKNRYPQQSKGIYRSNRSGPFDLPAGQRFHEILILQLVKNACWGTIDFVVLKQFDNQESAAKSNYVESNVYLWAAAVDFEAGHGS